MTTSIFSLGSQIPKNTKYIFVSDFFVRDVTGGAELTSDVFITSAPDNCFQLHSRFLTQELLYNNRDKYWIFGNFTQVPLDVIKIFSKAKAIKYSVIEYDFKFCLYRVPNKHKEINHGVCDCAKSERGILIKNFYLNARNIFWMSEGQKNKFEEYVPELKTKTNSFILSSAFSNESLEFFKKLRTNNAAKTETACALLSGGSWIKGVEQTKQWLEKSEIRYKQIPNLPYQQFLSELAKFNSLAFMPADWDTCPRLVIEAVLLGLNVLHLNDNVLHKNEAWFKEFNIETIENYLKQRPVFFWDKITQN